MYLKDILKIVVCKPHLQNSKNSLLKGTLMENSKGICFRFQLIPCPQPLKHLQPLSGSKTINSDLSAAWLSPN